MLLKCSNLSKFLDNFITICSAKLLFYMKNNHVRDATQE